MGSREKTVLRKTADIIPSKDVVNDRNEIAAISDR
jgi:hypothetical protein